MPSNVLQVKLNSPCCWHSERPFRKKLVKGMQCPIYKLRVSFIASRPRLSFSGSCSRQTCLRCRDGKVSAKSQHKPDDTRSFYLQGAAWPPPVPCLTVSPSLSLLTTAAGRLESPGPAPARGVCTPALPWRLIARHPCRWFPFAPGHCSNVPTVWPR